MPEVLVLFDPRSPQPRANARLPAMVVMAAALVAVTFPLLSAPRAGAATVTIEISDFAFQPATITVRVGDTVTWTNLDSAAHTATDAGSGALFDGEMAAGESFSYTFTAVGTFHYLCTFHPEMKGTVIVETTTAPGASQLPDAAVAGPHTTPGRHDRKTNDGAGGGSLPATFLGAGLLVLSLLAGARAWPRLERTRP